MPEEHHAKPAAQSPAETHHPQQRPLRDTTAPLALRLGLVDAVKDEAKEVDEEEIDKQGYRHIKNYHDMPSILAKLSYIVATRL